MNTGKVIPWMAENEQSREPGRWSRTCPQVRLYLGRKEMK